MPPADPDARASWIVLLRVHRLGARAESAQATLRDALQRHVREALATAEVRTVEYRLFPRSTGLGVLVAPGVQPAKLLRDFTRSLDDHLREHNATFRETHRLALCLGLHLGMVFPATDYVASRAVDDLTRLMEVTPTGPADCPSALMVVLSHDFHDLVVRAECPGIRTGDYLGLDVPAGPEGRPVRSWLAVIADGRAGHPLWAPAAPAAEPDVTARTDAAGPPTEPVGQPVPGISGPLIHPDFLLGDGGQGTVYGVVREVPGLSGPLAYKEYRAGVLRDPEVLQDMVRFLGDLAQRETRDHTFLETRLAWPLRLGHRRGRANGILMQQVPADYTMRLAPLGVSKQQTLEFLLNPDEYLKRIGLSADNGQRLLLLKDLAGILTTLHGHGITVGDLSPKNILFRLDVWPRCFLIDCDSMRFKGRDALPQVETVGWEVPELRKATPESDAYKLGLVALRLFNRSQEDKDDGPLRSVSTELADLAMRSQSVEPGRRPTPSAWQAALQRAIEGGKSDSSWIDVDPV
ncbi:hypothetical protein ACFY74_33160 [Streptomyces massasporeus]|uniref:hypothetical protein n=1 Tax=Streptomyces massasporeus TaxID=67324 RepID=UPI00368EE89D